MIRTLGGIAAGLGVAILTIILVEAVGNQFFPPPRGYDMNQASALSLPFETLVWPVIGWFLGALLGSWLALRVSGKQWTAWVVAGLVIAATIFNFALIKHPLWIIAAGLVAPILGSWIGQRLPRPSPSASAANDGDFRE